MSVSTSLPLRVSQRGRQRRRSRLRLLLVALLLALAAAGGGWLVLESSVLGVADVTVTGADRLTPDQVIGAADIPSGTPLARLDTGAVESRLSKLTVVAGVEVSRQWPRGVRISVRERTAVAVARTGSSWSLVDRDGVTFATVGRRPQGLPAVSAPSDGGPEALRAALRTLAVLPAQVAEQVRQVRAADPDHVTVFLSRGRTVVWGSTERAPRKAAVLAVLLTRPGRVYDVSAPDIPTTRR